MNFIDENRGMETQNVQISRKVDNYNFVKNSYLKNERPVIYFN